MSKLWIDFETRSLLSVKINGLDRYAKDPSTQVLMLAWAFDNEVPQLWQPRLGPMPDKLKDALHNKLITKCAWNYNFEKDILQYVLGIETIQDEWYDPSVLCGYMALPIGLHRAGEALSTEQKKIHITGDNRPLKMFCEPSKATKKMLKAGLPEKYFKDWDSHPDKWQIFCDYCIQDVIAEREVDNELVKLNCPMPESEKQAWLLDQRMNDAGVWVDQLYVNNAKKLAEEESNEILSHIKSITGVENPNSRDQVLGWLNQHGYPFPESLDGDSIDMALDKPWKKLEPCAREVLELKRKLGGSAYKKLQSILDRMGVDGRLRDQFLYHGAHTGRWSGRGVQLQNLYKPDKAASKVMDKLVTAIKAGTFTPDEFATMIAVASTIRASFAAAPGHKLLVGDLAQIESRVLAALAQCFPMIDAYAHGHDLYKEFMSWLLKKPVDQIDSDERARGKIVILGCGFGMGWEKFKDYAASFGVILTDKEAKEAVYGFREKYSEVKELWDRLDRECKQAVRAGVALYVNGCVLDGRNPDMFKIKLPSGRCLHYYKPRLITELNEWSGRSQESLTYVNWDAKGRQIKRLYGGLITENIVQAIARDILLNGMLEAEKIGIRIIMTIHDEIVGEVVLNSGLTHEDLLACMKIVPDWGEGMGFVLNAEGYEGLYYKKG